MMLPADPTSVSGSSVCLAYTAIVSSGKFALGCSKVRVLLHEGERASVVFNEVV